jgi:hypothetical protein
VAPYRLGWLLKININICRLCTFNIMYITSTKGYVLFMYTYTRTYTKRPPDHFCIGKEFPDPFLHFMAGNMAQFSISSPKDLFYSFFSYRCVFFTIQNFILKCISFECVRSTGRYWIFDPLTDISKRLQRGILTTVFLYISSYAHWVSGN